MMAQWIRLVKDTTEVSVQNGRESDTIAIDGTPILYLGKKAPFNNFFLWMDTLNISASNIQVSYYSGKTWVSAVDILDGTDSMIASGVVQFSPNKNHRWQKTADTSDETGSGLESFTIYDLYWLKIEFSVALDAGTTLKKVAYKFTDEEELKDYDSDIDEFLTAFGQVNWTNQILKASIEVANDFKKKGLITDDGQLLRFDDVTLPTAYKTLLLIYLSLGDSYKDRRDEIKKLYDTSFKGIYSIDKNKDGMESASESNVSSGQLTR